MSESLHELAGVGKQEIKNLVDEYVTTDLPESEFEERLEFVCNWGFDPEKASRGKVLFHELKQEIIDRGVQDVQNHEIACSFSDYDHLEHYMHTPRLGEMNGSIVLYSVPLNPYPDYEGDPTIVNEQTD